MAVVTASIPTYNRSVYLKEAIESVLAQTFGDFQLLISDNGSRDDTEEMVAEYARVDKRIVYHRFPTNMGSAKNWRYVLTHPDTEFVALLTDDDLWLPGHLENAVQALQEVPGASLFCCITESFEGGETKLYRPQWLEASTSRVVFDARRRFAPLLLATPMAAPSVVFRRRAFDQVVLYEDSNFAPGDWMLWGQLAMIGPLVFDPSVRARYRWHEGNDSNAALQGRRINAQNRFAVRTLATMALGKGVLDPHDLVEEVTQFWPIPPASTLVIALAAFDAPAVLRRAAFDIWARRPELHRSIQASTHCRMAGKVGKWYLTVADMVDRSAGCWWSPK